MSLSGLFGSPLRHTGSFPEQRLVIEPNLVDVQNLSQYNKEYKYLLTCIDIFSKYDWVVPLKTKQGQELIKAFQTILASARKP